MNTLLPLHENKTLGVVILVSCVCVCVCTRERTYADNNVSGAELSPTILDFVEILLTCY